MDGVCKQCVGPIPSRARGRGRKKTNFCSETCSDEWWSEARRRGARTLKRRDIHRPGFEEWRQRLELKRGVAEILAWAEAQHPATPEAWGVGRVVRRADARIFLNEDTPRADRGAVVYMPVERLVEHEFAVCDGSGPENEEKDPKTAT